MEWQYLAHVDTENLRIIIRAKGRHTNVIIGRPIADDETRVNPYFPLRIGDGTAYDTRNEIDAGLVVACAKISAHERAWDEQRAKDRAEHEAQLKAKREQRSRAHAPKDAPSGLRALAARDAAGKGIDPEHVRDKQRSRKHSRNDRSSYDAELRSKMRGR